MSTIDKYNSFVEDLDANTKKEKVINNWLQDMPASGNIIEAGDFERHIQNKK